MKLKLSIVIMSHLSDIQELLSFGGNPEIMRRRINFVKALILKQDAGVDEMDEKTLNELYKKIVDENNIRG